MQQIEYPILFISLMIPFLGSLFFPFLKAKLNNRHFSILSFFLLLIPGITAFILYLGFNLEEGIVEPSIFSHHMLGRFSMYLERVNALYLLGVVIVTPSVALYSHHYMQNRKKHMEEKGDQVPTLDKFYLLYTLFSVSMMGFLLTTNLFMQYIFLKITLLSSFALILLYGHGNRKRTATIYLVWSLVGGVVFLLGILGLGAEVGTFDIVDMSARELNVGLGEGLSLMIPFLIFFGMCIKKALFGVHIWLPHAHAEAPAPVSALLSPNLIGISGYVMISIVLEMFPDQFETLAPFFMILAFITMIYGGLTALAQDDLKRLLAYASVSQMGWVVFGIATMTPEGISGGILLFIKHSISLSILFMVAGILVSKYEGLRDISNMGGLLTMNPVLSGLTIVGFFTLVGAPLTMGFWGKTLIFSGAIKIPGITGPISFILVASAVIFAGGITASYCFITMKRMLFGGFKGKMGKRSIGWTTSTIPMAVIGFIGIFLFFIPGHLIGPAEIPRLSVLTIEGMMFLTAYLGAYFIFTGGIRYYLVLFSHRIEERVIDEFFHEKIPNFLEKSAKKLKHGHSGETVLYILTFILGLIIILLGLMSI